MIAKISAFLCIIGFASAGYLGGYGYSGLGYSGLGYSGLGYSGLGYGYGYSAPVVSKAVIPAVSYAPAISSSYVAAPVVKSYVAPVAYGGYGYGGLGYGSYGYGGKYLW